MIPNAERKTWSNSGSIFLNSAPPLFSAVNARHIKLSWTGISELKEKNDFSLKSTGFFVQLVLKKQFPTTNRRAVCISNSDRSAGNQSGISVFHLAPVHHIHSGIKCEGSLVRSKFNNTSISITVFLHDCMGNDTNSAIFSIAWVVKHGVICIFPFDWKIDWSVFSLYDDSFRIITETERC